MPFFIRTRRLSIKRLENKPQESLSVVHTILSSSVKEVLANLKRVERAYYGVGRNAQDELKKWISSVKGVMQVAQISNLVSASKIEEIIKEAAHPQSKFTVDLYDMNKLKESYRKIRDNIPDKFSDILIDLRSILKYLEKYCLSFYDPECEIPLETAQHYEKNRQENEAIIRENFEVITMLPHKFKSSDLWLSDFSSFGIETARKGESTCAPFLVLFPECCERIRIICSTMMSWIKGDSNYALFISNDVKDLEKKKEAILKIVRDLQQNYHQLLFRLKQVQSECYKLQRELEKLQAKEDELLTDEEVLISETNDMQLDIERKEYRRDELIHNAAHMHPQILYERYSELSEELRDLKMRLPFVKRQMFNVQYKLGWIGDKKEELRLEKKKLLELNKEIYSVDHQKQASEEELKNTVQVKTCFSFTY